MAPYGPRPPYLQPGSPGRTPEDARGAERSAEAGARSRVALGALGLLGIVAMCLPAERRRRRAPSQYVPARSGGWPAWMAGPLRGLGLGLSSGSFQTLMLVMCASYLLVLVVARRCRSRARGRDRARRTRSCCSARR